MKTKIILATVGLLSMASLATGHTHALIVGGITKDPVDRATKQGVVRDLKTCLLSRGGVDPNRMTVLTGKAARMRDIDKALDALASTVGREDRFIFYYIGQANAAAGSLRLNLVGADVTGQQLAQWLKRIEAKTQLVVLDCPHAAMAAKEMARPGRVLVFASTAAQAYGPRFSLHFVPALGREETDTNADGRVSVLEAFTATARSLEQWYRDNAVLATETPNLDDNADGVPSERPWRYVIDGGDGLAASKFILATL